MLEILMNAVTWLFNFILLLVGNALNLVLCLLPKSPFASLINWLKSLNIDEYLQYLAWLVPVDIILSITVLWVSAISIYFIYSIIMRWIKMIE
jgi:hypothetical protein